MKKKILIVEDQFIEASNLQRILEKAGYLVCNIARSVPIALNIIEKEPPDLVLLDIRLQGELTGIDLAKILRQKDIGFIYLSANSNQKTLDEAKRTHPYGFLAKPFREKDLLVTLDIAWYLHEESKTAKESSKATLKKVLAAIHGASVSMQESMFKIAKAFQPFIPFDFILFHTKPPKQTVVSMFSLLRTAYHEYQAINREDLLRITGMELEDLALYNVCGPGTGGANFYTKDDLENGSGYGLDKLIASSFRLYSALHFFFDERQHSGIYFFSKREDAFSLHHTTLLNNAKEEVYALLHSPQISPVLKPVAGFPIKIEADRTASQFRKIVGASPAFLFVLDQVAAVATSDTSVLLLGESGTGKERIADCIHQLSPRNHQPFIKVNCAALPPNLIESELFGYEKGSFTNAVEKRMGKFELATNGTIFLAEIGEMPKDTQVKLLRVLQEQEIDRIGGTTPIKINVRIIAATNCNLEKEVAEGRFRLDLYYRLNVFPIMLPPLRERKDDIEELAGYFLRQLATKSLTIPTRIAPEAMQALRSFDWPGNIRELENVIERTALLTKGTVIQKIYLPNPVEMKPAVKQKVSVTDERESILAAIKKYNGRISGTGGAAELLKIPATTLHSKMKKLGIRTVYT